MMTRKNLAGIVCAVIVAAIPFIEGCGVNYGSLKSSRHVTEQFENNKVEPGYNYFRAGAKEKSPDTILGLDGKYTLDNPTYWHPVNPNSIQDLVGNMQSDAAESNKRPYGSEVLNNVKEKIGSWYSIARDTVVKILKDEKGVIIYAPNSSGMEGGSSSGGGGSGGGGNGGN